MNKYANQLIELLSKEENENIICEVMNFYEFLKSKDKQDGYEVDVLEDFEYDIDYIEDDEEEMEDPEPKVNVKVIEIDSEKENEDRRYSKVKHKNLSIDELIKKLEDEYGYNHYRG